MSKAFRVRFLPIAVCAILTLLIVSIPEKVDATPLPSVLILPQINRIAGTAGTASFSGDGSLALAATLDQPEGVALDGAGNLYIADTSNNRIRRIDAATGIISTVAGNGSQGYNGDGIAATSASLDQPAAVLVDAHGNLYIADTGNRIVRFVNIKTGLITTVAGTANLTTFDPANIGDGGPATAAELDSPAALALDTAGNLYIADSDNNRVREVSAANGTITTVTGTGAASFIGDGGLATAATLNQPTGIGLDAANDLYIADSGNNRIRVVSATTGDIATVAGTGLTTYNGDSPSPGTAASTNLNFPTGLAVNPTGKVYFSDHSNNRVRELNTGAGEVVTLAGTGTAGFTGDGGLASAAEVNLPVGLAVDTAGELYVADAGSNEVRQISYGFHWPSAEVATTTPVTHTIFIEPTTSMTLTPPAIALAENNKQEFTVGAVSGAGCTMDGSTTVTAGTICQVPISFNPAYPGERTGALQFTLAGTTPNSFGLYGIGLGPQVAIVPGTIRTVISPGIAAADGIPLTTPTNGVSDAAGNIYIADPGTNLVLRQDATTAALTIVAGGGLLPPAFADGGPATDGLLNHPAALALDASGDLYIAEAGTNRIRKVDLSTGIITTVAGTGAASYTGDNGPATNATLNNPSGIAVDTAGDLFIADTANNVIRRVNGQTSIITTIAGTGVAGAAGDGGYALSAELKAPQGVAVDALGRLVIADTSNNRIQAVDPVTTVISSIAGNGTAAFSGDNGAAISASLNQPTAVALDAADDIYIADSANARIRKVYAASGNIATVAGSALVGDEGDGGSATAAALSQPSGVFLDSIGQIFIADQSNATVRQVTIDTPILNFGQETVGGTTAAQTDFLSNIGNQTLAVSAFTAQTDFPMASDAAQCAVGNLTSGNVCDLSFVFNPQTAGPLTENALLTDNALNAANAQQAVVMTGNGISATMVATAITVSVSPTTAIYGTPVVLTANVSSAGGPVTNGSVVFSINGVEVAGASLNGSGVAIVTLAAAPTGTDVVTASFAAQGNYDASGSNQATLIVTPAASQVTLTASTQQIRLGQNVIFTANVTSATTGLPTGNVIFLNGSAQIGEAILNGGGQAIFNTQNLPAGTDTITAQYLGDANFQTSTSNSVTVTVADDTLTMTVNPTQISIPVGKTAQATVTLTPKNGFAGTVNLSCAGLIQGATCQFSSATATFAAQTQTPQTFTLTINPNTVATSGFSFHGGRGGLMLRLFLLLMTLAAAWVLFRARKQSALLGVGRALLIVFCLGLGLGTLSGCKNLAPTMPVSDPINVQASMPSTGVIASQQLQVYIGQ